MNLFPINSTDYEIVANELKKTVALYDARMLVYDANGMKSLSLFAFPVNHRGTKMLTVNPDHYATMPKVA